MSDRLWRTEKLPCCIDGDVVILFIHVWHQWYKKNNLKNVFPGWASWLLKIDQANTKQDSMKRRRWQRILKTPLKESFCIDVYGTREGWLLWSNISIWWWSVPTNRKFILFWHYWKMARFLIDNTPWKENNVEKNTVHSHIICKRLTLSEVENWLNIIWKQLILARRAVNVGKYYSSVRMKLRRLWWKTTIIFTRMCAKIDYIRNKHNGQYMIFHCWWVSSRWIRINYKL